MIALDRDYIDILVTTLYTKLISPMQTALFGQTHLSYANGRCIGT